MTLTHLLDSVKIKETNVDLNHNVDGICYDTRNMTKNAAFVAIEGLREDGFGYVFEAVERGASVVISEKKPPDEIPFVLVEDARKALAILSANWFSRPAEEVKIIGVTGTNGKTSTTHLLKNILDRCGFRAGLIGTNENKIGDRGILSTRTTPESYELQKLIRQMADEGCTHVVMEVSSHALSLSRVEGIGFELAVFTNLTQDHLDFHGSMEAYGDAKEKLFQKTKMGLVNLDDSYYHKIGQGAKCPLLTFSSKDDRADFVARNVELFSDRVRFVFVMEGKISRVMLPMPGLFSVYNGLAALSAAVALGIEPIDAAEALSNAPPVRGRAEIVPAGQEFTVMIDYAHTPDGMKNILEAARGFTKGRLITVFGCGGDRDRSKRPLMGAIAARHSNVCIVTSDNPRTENPGVIIGDIIRGIPKGVGYVEVEVDRKQAIGQALKIAKKDDCVLLLGKGHEMVQEVGNTVLDFDERELVLALLNQSIQV